MLLTDANADTARREARARRDADPGAGRLPDFLIIGAAKSGTSTLHHSLARHPDVFVTRPKEPDFFDPAMTWDRGLEWYQSLFAAAGNDQICGESSTHYTRLPQVTHVPDRMIEIVPEVKLIYIMRHPVERAFSHYVHRHTKEVYPGQPFVKSFEAFVEDEPLCLDSSEYLVQIEDYLRVFPREQLLLLLVDDLRDDPGAVIATTCRFLGIDDTVDLLADGPLRENSREEDLDESVRREINGPLKSNPLVRSLAALCPRSLREAIYRLLAHTPRARKIRRSFEPTPMLPETRDRLIERYRPGVDALAEFLGRDLGHWHR